MTLKLTYPTKTNNPTDPDSTNKFFYNEANDIKEVVNSHANDIEANQAAAPPAISPFYGFFTSLPLLEVAHPTGVINAFAVIDPGAGLTKQIAEWDDVGGAWEITGAFDDKIHVANFAALPAPGIATNMYITDDKANIYFWIGGAYKKVGAAEFVTISQLNASKSARQTFTANQDQTAFSLSNSPVSVDVYIDRVYQLDGIDYNLLESDVILTDALDVGSIVVIRKYF